MGIVKSVQPYWRLAIITMQMIPIISWLQRVASETRSAGRSVCEIGVIGITPRRRVRPGAIFAQVKCRMWEPLDVYMCATYKTNTAPASTVAAQTSRGSVALFTATFSHIKNQRLDRHPYWAFQDTGFLCDFAISQYGFLARVFVAGVRASARAAATRSLSRQLYRAFQDTGSLCDFAISQYGFLA